MTEFEDKDKEYTFGRGGFESIRLTSQHHIFKSRQGWLLHPTVAEGIKNIPKPRVADVATGTGIWAIDLAEQMPHADIVGLDLTDQQFCQRSTLPPNVTLGLYDVLDEVPADLQETFDVVHIRLFLFTGPTADKSIFIDHFRKLLRPGGWLQWEELGYPPFQVCKPIAQKGQDHGDSIYRRGSGSGVNIDHVEEISMLDHPTTLAFNKYIGIKYKNGWVSDFEQVMYQHGGFDACKHYSIPPKLYHLQLETDSLQVTMAGIVETVIAKRLSDNPEGSKEMLDALAQVNAELKDGMLVSYTWHVGIARKV